MKENRGSMTNVVFNADLSIKFKLFCIQNSLKITDFFNQNIPLFLEKEKDRVFSLEKKSYPKTKTTIFLDENIKKDFDLFCVEKEIKAHQLYTYIIEKSIK